MIKQGKNYFADKRRELIIVVDSKFLKEPAHCHLIFKGERIGCILLEDETKDKTFKSLSGGGGGFFSKFKKVELRHQFDFIAEIDQNKLQGFIERYEEDCYRHAHQGANLSDEDTNMIFLAKHFAQTNLNTLIEEQKSL